MLRYFANHLEIINENQFAIEYTAIFEDGTSEY